MEKTLLSYVESISGSRKTTVGKIVECRKTFSDEKSLKANRFRMRFCIELQRCAKSETNPLKKNQQSNWPPYS